MPVNPVTHLLYLHGFRSSPRSFKATLVAQRIAQRHPGVTWWCPQLPPSPRAAMRLVMDGIAAWPAGERMGVMGSSLGGFYASWVAARRDCRAVVINPAVHPARDLARHIGEHQAWHDPQERFHFAPEYVGELEALEREVPTEPARHLAFIAKGDEVLDWREMAARHPTARQRVIEGGDHAFSCFGDHLDEALAFLGLA